MLSIEQRIQLIKDNCFHQYIGIEEISSQSGEGLLSFTVGDSVLNPNGKLHGGIFYALSDVCAYAGLVSLLPPSQDAVTHDIHVSVLRFAKGGDKIIFKSQVSKLGKRIAFINTNAYCEDLFLTEARVTKSIIYY